MRSLTPHRALLAVLLLLCACDRPSAPVLDPPTGLRILYTDVVGSFPTTTVSVVHVAPDGSGRWPVLEGVLLGQPRGDRMVYHGEPVGTAYLSTVDGMDHRTLDDIARVDRESVALSPDGSFVAFIVADRMTGNENDGHLVLESVNRETHRVLARSVLISSAPAFSPDGTRVAYYGANDSLYVVGADGAGTIALGRIDCVGDGSGAPGHAMAPAWTASGSQIAAGCYPYLIFRSDGGSLDEPPLYDFASAPSWSPDGSQIAVGSWDEILIHSPDGVLVRSLRTGLGPAYDVRWSPDGGRILFMASRYPLRDMLCTIDLPTGETRVIDSSAYNGYWIE